MANVLLLISIVFKVFHILSAVNGFDTAYFRKIRPCLQQLLIQSSQNTVLYAENHLFQSQTGANIAKNVPNRNENGKRLCMRGNEEIKWAFRTLKTA
jgi:hypothetical protein